MLPPFIIMIFYIISKGSYTHLTQREALRRKYLKQIPYDQANKLKSHGILGSGGKLFFARYNLEEKKERSLFCLPVRR